MTFLQAGREGKPTLSIHSAHSVSLVSSATLQHYRCFSTAEVWKYKNVHLHEGPTMSVESLVITVLGPGLKVKASRSFSLKDQFLEGHSMLRLPR